MKNVPSHHGYQICNITFGVVGHVINVGHTSETSARSVV